MFDNAYPIAYCHYVMATAISSITSVGYFRVSTPGQVGEHHVSLDVQQDAFRTYCLTNNLQPVGTFTDVASGRKDDRPQYQAMLKFIFEHRVDTVVVLFLDRFGRNPREILRRYWDLEENGIRVQSVNEDLREELLLLVRAGIAGAESKRTGERVKAAMHRAAERGRHMSRPPYGYIKEYQGKEYRLTQVPEEVEAVRLMYRLSVEENYGFRRIANELNRLGYRGKADSGSKLFERQTIKVILSNPSLKGDMAYGKREQRVIKSGIYPAILTDEEWNKLQQRLAIHREGQHKGSVNVSNYLLSGIAHCGHCGGKMVGATARSRRGDSAYYTCGNRRDRAVARCDTPNRHSARILEQAVLEYLGQFSDPEKVRGFLSASEKTDTKKRETELSRARKKLKALEIGLLNDLDRLDRGVIQEQEFSLRNEARRKENADLQSRESELSQQVDQIKNSQEYVEQLPGAVGSFLDDMQKMEIRWQKAQLQTILKAAHIYRDGNIELEFREQLKADS